MPPAKIQQNVSINLDTALYVEELYKNLKLIKKPSLARFYGMIIEDWVRLHKMKQVSLL